MQVLLDIEDSINIDDFMSFINRHYPNKKIISLIPKLNKEIKKFEGIDDLKTLNVENFTMYSRDELYDR